MRRGRLGKGHVSRHMLTQELKHGRLRREFQTGPPHLPDNMIQSKQRSLLRHQMVIKRSSVTTGHAPGEDGHGGQAKGSCRPPGRSRKSPFEKPFSRHYNERMLRLLAGQGMGRRDRFPLDQNCLTR